MRVLALATLCAAAAGCGGPDYGSSAPPPASCTTASATAVTGPILLSAGNRFVPSCGKVAAGTSVTFTNADAMAHTSTADGGQFDSGALAPGASFSFTFATPGAAGIHCSLHAGMRMTLVVE
jgi:plastocyanin